LEVAEVSKELAASISKLRAPTVWISKKKAAKSFETSQTSLLIYTASYSREVKSSWTPL
jgi:lysine/ornithine N-monooxygenase